MGFVDIHKDRDLWEYTVHSGVGSASTINTSIEHDAPRNPIGFIWPKEDDNKESR